MGLDGRAETIALLERGGAEVVEAPWRRVRL